VCNTVGGSKEYVDSLVENPEGKRLLWKYKYRWKDKIESDI